VNIELKKEGPGNVVSVGFTRPTAAIEQAVQDFVGAYNELAKMIATATKAGVNGDAGPLRGDLGVREMQRQLSQLSTMTLSSVGDGPHTLAEIGVRTNRDGSLSVNTSQLQAMLQSNPDGVEALFNPTQYSSSPFLAITSPVGRVKPGVYTITDVVPEAGAIPASGKIDGLDMLPSGAFLIAPAASKAAGLILGVSGAVSSATVTVDAGLGGALKAIRDALRATTGPFASSEDRLEAEADKIADDRADMETRAEKYYNQLLNTFTSMERQVSAFKATQSYLEQQVKIWTADRG
jgi:flagellar hook-associated protein 2